LSSDARARLCRRGTTARTATDDEYDDDDESLQQS
jgi:hypothetical protein